MTDDSRKTRFKIYPPFFSQVSNTNTITLPSAPVGSILTIGVGGTLTVLPPSPIPGQALVINGSGQPAYATTSSTPLPSNTVTTIGVSDSSGLVLGTGSLGGARDLNGDVIQTNKAVLTTGLNLFKVVENRDVGVAGNPATSDVFFVHSNIVAKSAGTDGFGVHTGIAYRIQALFKYDPHNPAKIVACGEDRLVLEDDALDLDHLGGAGHGFDATLDVINGFIVVRVTQGNIGGTWTWREDTYAVCI